MSKKMMTIVVVLFVVFAFSMIATVAMAAKPGCNTCKRDGCPTGQCYVDCAGCCFYKLGILYCYR